MTKADSSIPDSTAVKSWLTTVGWEADHIECLDGDVSSRSYFRALLPDAKSVIVAFYPPSLRETCDRFMLTTEFLNQAGVLTPRIFLPACDAGFMVLQDVGSETLYSREIDTWSRMAPILRGAVELLHRIQSISVDRVQGINPPLDSDLMKKELEQTWMAFLEPHGFLTDTSFAKDLQAGIDELCSSLGSGNTVTCHRDYMVRNIVEDDDTGDLVVLDHQDLRAGPRFYDLASLLNDSLDPSSDIENALIGAVIGDEDEALEYQRAAVQRTLKAIGTFETFAKRGSNRHLRLIPQTMKRALRYLKTLPETSDLTPRLAETWDSVLRGKSGAVYR